MSNHRTGVGFDPPDTGVSPVKDLDGEVIQSKFVAPPLDSPTFEHPLEKAKQKAIPLVELFGPTIQGEGNVIGQQTYFLRFGLCDYKCEMCDSLHAVLPQLVKANAEWHTQEDIATVFNLYRNSHGGKTTTDWVTFSGGNPAIHDLTYLVGLLKLAGIKINVETQGTLYKGWLNKVDNLTISPKGPGMGEHHDQRIFEGFMNKVHENGAFIAPDDFGDYEGPELCIKIVAFDQRDLDFAAEIFDYLSGHPLFKGKDTSKSFYLSLGNPNPPKPDTRNNADFSIPDLFKQYRILQEEIQNHPILSKVRFLPQFHTIVWGNGDGH